MRQLTGKQLDNTLKIIIFWLCVLWVLMLMASCKNMDIHQDRYNPCNVGTRSYDKCECEFWKARYPKDHAKYLKRYEAKTSG